MRLFLSTIAFLFLVNFAFADDHFEKRVRPLLVSQCFSCHCDQKVSGGLRLDSREAILKGGDSGPGAIAQKPDASLLIKAVEHRDELRMPPKKKLSDAEIRDLKQWIAAGLPWPNSNPSPVESMTARTNFSAEQRRWWSFQPVVESKIPAVKNEAFAKTEIDRFLLAAMEAKGMSPNLPADKRSLIRRATYDLTGLPPTVAETDGFLQDNQPDAFKKVVDRLLASKAYGERWGRHWLDLVRYADTAGENSDHPVPHAWRYRNWVIDAFNRDLPYDQFIREQIAGDLIGAKGLPDQYADRLVATGFLSIARRFGHDIDKDIHLTHEDVIDTTSRAFMGVSLACARCHDHKYDPFTARDYYAIQGILQSTKFSFPGCEPQQQPRDLFPLLPPSELAKTVEPYRKRLAEIDSEFAKTSGSNSKELVELRSKASALSKLIARGEIADGKSVEFKGLDGQKLLPLKIGVGEILKLSVLPMKNHGADSTLIEWEIAEVGGQNRRWNLTTDVIDNLLAGNPHQGSDLTPGRWWFLDGRDTFKLLAEPVANIEGKQGLNGWRNGDTPSVYVNSTKETVSVWTKLPPRSLFVHPAADGSVAVAWVSPADGMFQITGRIADVHPGGPDGVGWTLEHVAVNLSKPLKEIADVQAKLTTLAKQRAELIANAPNQEVAYAVTEGKAADGRIHLRGDPEKLGPVVPRRWLEVLGGETLPKEEGSGRLQLAKWLSDPKNPLTARVMVNRIWQHHFGKGLVRTPNDFGTRGMKPTNPALLDYLASKFVSSGWSIKSMHREMMLSAAYQQSASVRNDFSTIDANNELVWKFERRRISGEELRDSLLNASGQLDRTPGGPHPFPPTNTWGFSQHVPFSTFYDSNKRSVYLVSLRNRRHPFLGLFDGADPNASTPERQVTTVPTQALYFLNDPFFHAQASAIAASLPAGGDTSLRLNELFRKVFQRSATAKEVEMANAFLIEHRKTTADKSPSESAQSGWSALVRIILASNEFLYVE